MSTDKLDDNDKVPVTKAKRKTAKKRSKYVQLTREQVEAALAKGSELWRLINWASDDDAK